MDSQDSAAGEPVKPKPLTKLQRRILGVLIEKARTTPDAYPMSLAGLVAGANQKSNRSPLMTLSPEQIEDELIQMRSLGMVAEVQGSGRVARYRHYGYDYLGVKGAEAAVMTELLLRGEQTAGDLRARASRFEPIADLPTLNEILKSLIGKGLVIALTPPGRGQVFSHNLYQPEELTKLKNRFAGATAMLSIVKLTRPAMIRNRYVQVVELAVRVSRRCKARSRNSKASWRHWKNASLDWKADLAFHDIPLHQYTETDRYITQAGKQTTLFQVPLKVGVNRYNTATSSDCFLRSLETDLDNDAV